MQLVDLSVLRCSKPLYRKHLVPKSIYLENRKVCQTLIICLQMVLFTVATWQQVTHSPVVKRLRKCSCGHELNAEVDLGSYADMKKRLMPPTKIGLSKALRMSSILMYL